MRHPEELPSAEITTEAEATSARIDLSAISEMNIDAFLETQRREPTYAHELALRGLTRENPRLALRLLQEAAEGRPVDAITLAGIILAHNNNLELERELAQTSSLPAEG